jgi:hypothetical protein
MRKRSGFVARVLIVVALAGALQMALGPSAPQRSPYLSALSDAFAGQVQAATGCEMKDCAGGSRHNIVCAKVTSPSQCSVYHGFCLGKSC